MTFMKNRLAKMKEKKTNIEIIDLLCCSGKIPESLKHGDVSETMAFDYGN
jgi:hypothetical protein